MNVRRVLLRLAAFFAAFAAAISLVVLLSPRPRPYIIPAHAAPPAFASRQTSTRGRDGVAGSREGAELRAAAVLAARREASAIRSGCAHTSSLPKARPAAVWVGDAAEIHNPFAGGEARASRSRPAAAGASTVKPRAPVLRARANRDQQGGGRVPAGERSSTSRRLARRRPRRKDSPPAGVNRAQVLAAARNSSRCNTLVGDRERAKTREGGFPMQHRPTTRAARRSRRRAAPRREFADAASPAPVKQFFAFLLAAALVLAGCRTPQEARREQNHNATGASRRRTFSC